MKTMLVVLLLIACFATGWAFEPTISGWLHDDPIDCGPYGEPALEGKVCIDKHPVTVTVTR